MAEVTEEITVDAAPKEPEQTEEAAQTEESQEGGQPEGEVLEGENQEAESDSPEDEVSEEEEGKLPFPNATIVRIMKKNLDSDKMIKKDVKIAMNKWLGKLCQQVSTEMNRVPYAMLHLHEFEAAKRAFDSLETFQQEKERILAHFDAIKKDIEMLENTLGRIKLIEEVE